MSPAVLLGPKQHRKCGVELTLDLTYRGRSLWCNVKQFTIGSLNLLETKLSNCKGAL